MNIVDYIFPQAECYYCKKEIYTHQFLCSECEERLENFKRSDCISGNIIKGHILYYYEDLVKEMMIQFKYLDKRFYSKLFGRLMSKKIKEMDVKFDVVIPVPSHWRRKSSRGYNQATILANEIARSCGLPCNSKYLKRSANTNPMKKMNPTERVVELQNVFEINGDQTYENILLVDDICTTGATIESCGRVLYESETSQIIFIAFSGNY